MSLIDFDKEKEPRPYSDCNQEASKWCGHSGKPAHSHSLLRRILGNQTKVRHIEETTYCSTKILHRLKPLTNSGGSGHKPEQFWRFVSVDSRKRNTKATDTRKSTLK